MKNAIEARRTVMEISHHLQDRLESLAFETINDDACEKVDNAANDVVAILKSLQDDLTIIAINNIGE